MKQLHQSFVKYRLPLWYKLDR